MRILSGLFLLVIFQIPFGIWAQSYTLEDTLRGRITAERMWWDLLHYNLSVTVDVEGRFISGVNEVRYRVLSSGGVMQIDLQEPMLLESAEQDGRFLSWERRGRNAWFIRMPEGQVVGTERVLRLQFSGKPREARRAPWDGGFSWSRTPSGRPFVATSCQGLGASVWWPCKDHMYDEPDSMRIAVRVASGLTDVSNGRLRSVTLHADSSRTFVWAVVNPINNYGVNVNIAPYVHFSDTLMGELGVLDLDFYVLPEHLERARVHFRQVGETIRALEYWYGPYPFYADGYKLVEVPYLGMEHQSSVTYGNGFRNGYRGTDLSGTGWGLKWDFIIVHETGHEWFANSITYKDMADMWIHESFTSYAEGLFTEYYYGREAGFAYLRGLRRNIENKEPIIPDYEVNAEGPIDMYYKGSNLLHTLRQCVDNDSVWRSVLRGLNREFYHRTVTTAEVEAYISRVSGHDFSRVFDQYLRRAALPRLEYRLRRGRLSYRWVGCVSGFDMPLRVTVGGRRMWLQPREAWNHLRVGSGEVVIDPDFYLLSTRRG